MKSMITILTIFFVFNSAFANGTKGGGFTLLYGELRNSDNTTLDSQYLEGSQLFETSLVAPEIELDSSNFNEYLVFLASRALC